MTLEVQSNIEEQCGPILEYGSLNTNISKIKLIELNLIVFATKYLWNRAKKAYFLGTLLKSK